MSGRSRSEARRAAREEAKRARRAGGVPGSPFPSGGPAQRLPRARKDDAWWVVASAIALFGLLAYHRSFGNPFVFDDLRSIQENPTIRSFSWKVLDPPVPRAVTNRPVVNASFAINYAIGGLDVVSFHVLNLLIHMGAALLLYGIVRRTLELPSLRHRFPDGGSSWIAGAIATLWLVHPLAGESVTYVVQRTESLMGFFYLLVLYCVLRGATDGPPVAWNFAALVALGLGLGSKESMVTAPLAVLVYDRLFLSPSFREAFRRRATFYGAILAVVVLVVATTRTGGAVQRVFLYHLGQKPAEYGGYLLTQCEALLHYLRLSFWPWPIAGDYDDWPKARTLGESFPALLVSLALLGATAWGLLRKAPLAFLGAWFFLALLPTSIVPLHKEIVADRRMYLPLAALVALCVFAGWAGIERILPGEDRRPGRRRLAAGLTLALALLLSGVTMLRTLDFASGEAFWKRVVSERPLARRGRINLGYYTLWSGRIEEAIGHFETAVANDPKDKQAHFGLAGAFQRAGRTDAAIAEYRKAIEIDRRYSKAHDNLSKLLAAKGRTKLAEWHARVARNPRLVPRNWFPPGMNAPPPRAPKAPPGRGPKAPPARGPASPAVRGPSAGGPKGPPPGMRGPAARAPGRRPPSVAAPAPRWRPPLVLPQGGPAQPPPWTRRVVPSANQPPGWRPPLRPVAPTPARPPVVGKAGPRPAQRPAAPRPPAN